jgi:excisionase family DNA binding protein
MTYNGMSPPWAALGWQGVTSPHIPTVPASFLPFATDCRGAPTNGKFMEPICISVIDTMRALGIGRTKVYELINAGQLETVKIGRRTLVKIASIHALAGEGRTNAA